MNVSWINLEERVDRAESLDIDPKKILDKIESCRGTMINYDLSSEVDMDLDIRNLLKPLGRYGRILMNERNYSEVADALRRFWSLTGEPFMFADVIHTEKEVIPIRVCDYQDKKRGEKIVRINRLFDGVNKNFNYDRIVIGTDGVSAEFQFLDKTKRRNVRVGDAVDCGLFVHINGALHVSAGINRLVCNNGMTERFNVFKGSDIVFGEEFTNRAIALAEWFKGQVDKKIEDVREIEVVFNKFQPSTVNRLWKDWSIRVASNNLTWFDVINDLTNSVNDTLSGKRYEVLSVTNRIMRYEDDHMCPTCKVPLGDHSH